ncbi:histidine phosphatase family protein [Ornithinibacillus salinisoli]|uniref:Histidine phosphatase family protein n=1 Tax=Ornithinibacillus salinisoli TaxID=1848459 RepID=A0ABW4W0W2_9BACI
MVTKLYLTRHAHSVYTPDEWNRPLSKRGLTDAKKVTQILANENIDVVLSSPYKRAVQTVEGVANTIGKGVIHVEDYKERRLSEAAVDDFDAAITKVWEDFTFAWPGGESNIVAQNRGIQAIFETLETYEGKNVVIGTHGNLMVLMMNYFNSSFDFYFWKELDMPDIYALTFAKTELVKTKRIWTV